MQQEATDTVHPYLAEALAHHRSGNTQLARSTCDAILAQAPGHPEALHVAGLLAHEDGALDDALTYLTRAAFSAPEVARYQDSLGVVLYALNRKTQAVSCFELAHRLDPKRSDLAFRLGTALIAVEDFGEGAEALVRSLRLNDQQSPAWNALGVALKQLGRKIQAIECFATAIKLQPEHMNARFQLATLFHQVGRYDLAVEQYAKQLEFCPEIPESHNNLGAAYMAKGQIGKAIGCFQEAVRLRPEYAEAHANLGAALAYQGFAELPMHHLDIARQQNPKSTFIQVKYGRVLLDLGKIELACHTFQEILKTQPNNVAAITSMASTLERKGKFHDALSLLEPLVHSGQRATNVGSIYGILKLRTGRPEDALPLIREMTQFSRPIPERILLLHTLGDLYDAMGSVDEAFLAHQEANDLQNGRFDPAHHHYQISRIMEAFGVGTMPSAMVGSGVTPVFIIGMPRSGTTLVEQIIDSHPKAFGAGEREEIRILSQAIPRILGGGAEWPECVAGLPRGIAEQLGSWYLHRVGSMAKDATLLVDKMPLNYLHLGLIAHLFPQAKIIHCSRSPSDTGLSCFFQNFKANYGFANRVDWIAEKIIAYRSLMDHWRSVLPLPILDIQYEQLVTNPAEEIQRILGFCGLDWDQDCMDFHKNHRTVVTASYHQVRRPVYTSSIGRSESYRSWLGPLSKLEDS